MKMKRKSFYRKERKERKGKAKNSQGNAKGSSYLFFFALFAFFAVEILCRSLRLCGKKQFFAVEVLAVKILTSKNLKD